MRAALAAVAGHHYATATVSTIGVVLLTLTS